MYFTRIVLVYCVMVGCMVIAGVLSLAKVAGMDHGVVLLASGFRFGIQGWANFAVIWTKPGVGKTIRDLFVGTACRRGGSNQSGSNGHATSAEPTGRQTEPTTQGDGGTAIREGAEDDEAKGGEGNGDNRGARPSVQELGNLSKASRTISLVTKTTTMVTPMPVPPVL